MPTHQQYHSKSTEERLVEACYSGDYSLVQSLIEDGVNVNCILFTGTYRILGGTSPLMKASMKGHTSIVKLLLMNGAQVNLQNNNGESALMKASCSGFVDTARLLLEYGANVNLKSINGNTALSGAKDDEMLDLLMLASIPQFIDLLLPIAHKWRDLGNQLGLDEATLDSFQATIEKEKSHLQAVMTTWSKQTHPHDPTWRGLIRAVQSVDTITGHRIDSLHRKFIVLHISPVR